MHGQLLTTTTISPGQTTTALITTASSTTDSDDPSSDSTDPGEGSGVEVTVNVEIHYGNGASGPSGHVISCIFQAPFIYSVIFISRTHFHEPTDYDFTSVQLVYCIPSRSFKLKKYSLSNQKGPYCRQKKLTLYSCSL